MNALRVSPSALHSLHIAIRSERPDDRPAIKELLDRAFETPDVSRMVDRIRTSGRFEPDLALVADWYGLVAGYILLSPAELDTPDGPREVLSLSPLGVRPAFQRHGIGSALTWEAIRRAGGRDEPLILVLGHPWLYPRFGFGPAAEAGIEPPEPLATPEAFMMLPLDGYDPGSCTGRLVRYPGYVDETREGER